ncbi:MAG: sce7726 family protein [Mesorhizobium sp.]
MKAGEINIKISLLEYLVLKKGIDGIYINEFTNNNCGVRADLAVLNNQSLHAFEVKSDLDTCRRLSEQVRLYDLYFDRYVVVCTRKHLDNVTSIVRGTRSGVYLYEDGQLYVKRRGRHKLIANETILRSLLPSSLPKSNQGARVLLSRSLTKRYGENLKVIERIKVDRSATDQDILDLNPHNVRKRAFRNHLKKSDEAWMALANSNHRPNRPPC